MKYKVTFIRRNRISTEVDAVNKEDAYWKASAVVTNGAIHKDFDVAILGPTNLKIKEIK